MNKKLKQKKLRKKLAKKLKLLARNKKEEADEENVEREQNRHVSSTHKKQHDTQIEVSQKSSLPSAIKNMKGIELYVDLNFDPGPLHHKDKGSKDKEEHQQDGNDFKESNFLHSKEAHQSLSQDNETLAQARGRSNIRSHERLQTLSEESIKSRNFKAEDLDSVQS
ncbi:hypothetical protein K7X08_012046 [Anisodus acutangulus]|uniref:Uncharacterized protein n=1 Tax=Anisodus acutangulus TaxID=402998 RepID=A0A9Q1L9L7_9SOLA|nr:hypothetical protein K7X08_012046 [Anisodus acutangulus]